MTSVPPANIRAGPLAPASRATAACRVSGASYLRSTITPPITAFSVWLPDHVLKSRWGQATPIQPLCEAKAGRFGTYGVSTRDFKRRAGAAPGLRQIHRRLGVSDQFRRQRERLFDDVVDGFAGLPGVGIKRELFRLRDVGRVFHGGDQCIA